MPTHNNTIIIIILLMVQRFHLQRHSHAFYYG